MTQTKYIAPYRPLGWQYAPLRDKSLILLLTGAAGGGKSRVAAEKIHAFCQKYPGAMALMLRKTRNSMTNSTVLFFEREIIGGADNVRHYSSKLRFEYANGSIVAYGGMADEEQREQIRSIGQGGGLDIVWMEEATRFTEADFNEILARMRGTAAPWRQIILTTNPDAPTHWIKTRLMDRQQASVYYSSAVDNPHNPDEYISILQQMTGIQKLRLLDGKWIQAEGVVYPNWDMANVTTDAEYNPDLDLYWAVDDGYVAGGGPGTASYHPRVILFMQHTAIGGVNVVDEYYATGEMSETSIANALAKPYKQPYVAYVDSSAAELKGRLWNTGIQTVGATHPVHEGIKNLRRMICDGNGVRLFRIHPRCVNLNRELSSYRYDDASSVANIGEPKPLKIDDHGGDAARYGTFHLRFGS
jgi:PBSX family phage terminase large subunit